MCQTAFWGSFYGVSRWPDAVIATYLESRDPRRREPVSASTLVNTCYTLLHECMSDVFWWLTATRMNMWTLLRLAATHCNCENIFNSQKMFYEWKSAKLLTWCTCDQAAGAVLGESSCRESPGVATSRIVSLGVWWSKFCRSAWAIQCKWQFLSVG